MEHILPPPGLELPVAAQEIPAVPVALEAPPGIESPEPPKDFQVLFRNLPESVCNEPMMRVMLEQASLDEHIFSIETRPGGKALVSFSSLHAACLGMHHFHGRQWDSTSDPVTALYVRKVKTNTSAPAPAFNKAAPVFVPDARMSADAPVFNPDSKTENDRDRSCSDVSLSADALVFNPEALVFNPDATVFNPDALVFNPDAAVFNPGFMMDKMKDGPRDRFYSDASTAIPGDASEDSDPEMEMAMVGVA